MSALTITQPDPALAETLLGLGFSEQNGALVRHGVTPRFAECFDEIVEQAAGRRAAPWEDALALVAERADGLEWTLVGSCALAIRGVDVQPHDVDLVAASADCDAIAASLDDVLIEPCGDGGRLGRHWFRAFAGARIEGVGGIDPGIAVHVVGDQFELVEWRGLALRVPSLDLQLASRRSRGLL